MKYLSISFIYKYKYKKKNIYIYIYITFFSHFHLINYNKKMRGLYYPLLLFNLKKKNSNKKSRTL